MSTSSAAERLRAARDHLVSLRTDYAGAAAAFTWPQIDGPFNWAIDWSTSTPEATRRSRWSSSTKTADAPHAHSMSWRPAPTR